ncbi:AAA-like domain-containing protein [Marinospirillum celere]|uniref:AAA-like domain-containing protein n=1 Tax=Marinospirillum celere TaxID=1122252 RepID=A0A1I1GQV2_9GAMM|nr:AAA-like domain-containing protein [Marinospirillum celere]SFC13876.1 AAA-like domain-containing protein [Marinospirillum celere]
MILERFFNTAGPTIPADHYHIDLLHRLDWEEIQHLVASKRYFVLHAPRQTGKTSTLLAMMKAFNAAGHYACAYANIEGAQAARGDETQGIPAACDALVNAIDLYLDQPQLLNWYEEKKSSLAPQHLLTQVLQQWAKLSEKPTILLLDEVDALVGDTLISLLRQIRAGYGQRPDFFPQSIILCGVRDVRDYRMHQEGTEVITGGSAFNIKAESLRMGNFTEQETHALWQQHSQETGQEFDPAIFPELWEDTRGQPWLVNALGYEVTWKNRKARDRSHKISLTDYQEARERLIYSRATHLDQLSDKLKEPRVHSVISRILSTDDEETSDLKFDDLQYVEDLGLINLWPSVKISNRIYQEVLPRELTWPTQVMIANQEQAWYINDDHSLNMEKLLKAFQQFFREHSDSWSEGFDYKEAAPQLLMQAFLQRIINGGGRISREYGLGRKRTDLFIEWPLNPEEAMYGPLQRVVIELKILRGSLETAIEKGLEQATDYTQRVGAEETHLVVFNRDPATPWDQKIWQREETYQDRNLKVWGA